MKVVAMEIEVIAYFDTQGIVNPLRFKYTDQDGSEKVIKIDKVIDKKLEKLCGNLMWIYDCQSLIDGIVKPYQLKFDIQKTSWILFKI